MISSKSDSFSSEKLSLKKVFLQYKWISLSFLVILSLIFDLILLTKYSISYGRDGPYYDIQVRNILQTGFPISNDPPLVYYYMVPFVVIFGSFLGIKIAMSLISSLIAVPTFLLLDHILEKKHSHSPFISLLGAFLSVFNWYYLRMIEDFMQNLAGVFFFLFFVYFFILTLEESFSKKKNIILSFTFFILTIAIHLYTAAFAIVLLSIGLFSFFIIKGKTISKKTFLLLSLSLLTTVVTLLVINLIFPTTFSTFSKVRSFVKDLFSSTTTLSPRTEAKFVVFLTFPYIFGIIFFVKSLITSIKNIKDTRSETVPKQFYSSLLILSIAIILFFLTLPFIPSEWSMRFVLLAFVPISLITPTSLIVVEGFLKIILSNFNITIESKKKALGKNIYIFSTILLFALSGFFSAYFFSSGMGPTITEEEYQELLDIKALIPSQISQEGIIINVDSDLRYWVEYILDIEIYLSSNFTAIIEKYTGPFYAVKRIYLNSEAPFDPFNPTEWNIFLPYAFGSATQNELNQPLPPPNLSTSSTYTAIGGNFRQREIYSGKNLQVFELIPQI